MKLLATIGESSNNVGSVLSFFNVGCGVSELASMRFTHRQADVITEMSREFSPRDAFLLEEFGLFADNSLYHGVAVGLRVHYTHAVQLHALLVIFVLFVKFNCGGAA